MPFCVFGWQILCDEVTPDVVLDIRQPDRFARGHLPGARNLPYERVQAEALPLSGTVLVVDAEGARAAEMATWLRARGVQAGYLEGGMAVWTGPLERT